MFGEPTSSLEEGQMITGQKTSTLATDSESNTIDLTKK